MSSTKLVHLISSRVLALIAALALTMLSFTARSFRANGFFRTTKTVFSCRAAYSARYSSHADAAEAEFCAEMEHRLKLTIDSMRIPTNSSILLCVSGGSDSVALLVLMDQLRKQYLPSLSLSVVNYNHKLRSESDEEAQYVESLCQARGIQFFTRTLPESLRVSVGLQNTARDWRRSQNAEILDSIIASGVPSTSFDQESTRPGVSAFVATAHHKDDQIETMILKLLRGVHLTNFQEMSAVTGHSIKPMLDFTKLEIQRYLMVKGIAWREDVSNADRKYKRNAVRLDLVPVMTDLAGGTEALANRFKSLSYQSHKLKDWINFEIQNLVGLDRLFSYYKYHRTSPHEMNLTAEILSLPHLVLSEILHKWVASAVKVELCSDQINGLIELIESPINVEQPTIAVTIEKEWDIEKVHNTLRIKFRSYEDSSELATSTIKIQQTENSSAFNRSIVEISHPSDIIIREYSAEGGEPQVSQYTFPVFDSFDCKYCLRYADPSDTFFPTWKDKEMKLSKFLRAQKVPLPARDRVWVLIKTRSPTNSLISNRSSSELETTPDEVVAVLLEDGVVQISKPFTNLTSTVDKKAVAQLSIDLRQFDASGGRGNKFEVKFN